MYSFVALEKLCRMGWTTIMFILIFEDKNVMEDECVLEPNDYFL